MKRVYVAGALNADAVGYIKNMAKMSEMSNTLRKLGFATYNPCLDFLEGFKFGNYEYQDYFNNNQAWLEVSDAVFLVPGWENSKGTKLEIDTAMELGIPVFDDLYKLVEFYKILE